MDELKLAYNAASSTKVEAILYDFMVKDSKFIPK